MLFLKGSHVLPRPYAILHICSVLEQISFKGSTETDFQTLEQIPDVFS